MSALTHGTVGCGQFLVAGITEHTDHKSTVVFDTYFNTTQDIYMPFIILSLSGSCVPFTSQHSSTLTLMAMFMFLASANGELSVRSNQLWWAVELHSAERHRNIPALLVEVFHVWCAAPNNHC